MLFALDVLCLSYMVSIRRLLKFCVITPPPEPFFTRFVGCFIRNTLSTFLCYDEIITKNNVFSKQNKFSLWTYYWSVLILLFWVNVFLLTLFQSSAIIKLGIVSYLHICIAYNLVSPQIIWHKIRIHGHGLKITSCCYFFSFWGS